ncbi:hypothetical protein ACF3NG_07475 [Aerococcaceae bacterium WGS1372]
MKEVKVALNAHSDDIVVGEDDFVINAKELIEELELIGDYKGIEEIKKDLDNFKSK